MRLVSFRPSHPAWPIVRAAFDGDDLLAIGGVAETDGIRFGWMLFTDMVRPRHFIGLDRIVRRALEDMGLIEAHVDPMVPAAMRWARLLGFEVAGETMINGRKMLTVTRHA